jgi:transposase
MLARHPDSERLLQVHGVGPVTTSVYMAVVGDPRRFRRSRDVAAYVGLVPGQDQSGEEDPQLGISKAGDHLCRRVLVQCAQYILGHYGQDSALRRWGLKLAGDGKNRARKKKAVVAVARKLAILLHRLWVTGERYEPLRGCREAGDEVAA